MKFIDYYTVLGVDKTASQDEIKQAYKALAKKHHPDANKNSKVSEEKFKEIGEAYEVLGNKQKRAKYDELQEQTHFQNGTPFDPTKAGYTYSSNAQEQGHDQGQNQTGEYDDFADFFNAYFGGGGINIDDLFASGTTRSGRNYRTGNFSRRGVDAQGIISITPEEGFHGQKKQVTLSDGMSTRTISFKIPAGIKPGEKIKLAGQGGKGQGGGESGDLYIGVNFTADGRLRANGLDLEMTLELYPWDAALGSEVQLTIIDDTIKLKTPPGIQTDGKIRVAGKGYKDRSGKRGDLYIKVRIINPRALTTEMKDLYEKMKQLENR
jgi:curved DNA-binding protein